MKGQKLERKIYGFYRNEEMLEVNQIGKASKVGQNVVVDRTEVKVRLFLIPVCCKRKLVLVFFKYSHFCCCVKPYFRLINLS